MKIGDLARMEYTGKHYTDMEWETSYMGLVVSVSFRQDGRTPRSWRILISDSDGTCIGTFPRDYWSGTTIQ